MGNRDGEDIINIIVGKGGRRFIARHMYNFFVADTQVPAWQNTPPRDPEAIKMLEDEYFRSNCDESLDAAGAVQPDFFKDARPRQESCAVIGTMRLG